MKAPTTDHVTTASKFSNSTHVPADQVQLQSSSSSLSTYLKVSAASVADVDATAESFFNWCCSSNHLSQWIGARRKSTGNHGFYCTNQLYNFCFLQILLSTKSGTLQINVSPHISINPR